MLKPEGQRLRLLVRVPLVAMRDMAYPQRGSVDLLDLARAEQTLRDAATLWIADDIELYEDDVRLEYPRVVEVRASLAGDRSFTSYDEALAHVTGPRLPDDAEFFWSQGLLDILFEYPIRSDQSKFSIRPKLARLGIRTVTVLRFLPPGGAVRAFEFVGDPGLVRLDPRWHQAALQFVKLGFSHILDGIDHLLFLFCLVIPFRRFRSLVAVVTSFTVAHSITLIASAYNLAPDALWFPPLIETLIATSIVYMALENIVFAERKLEDGLSCGLACVRWLCVRFGLVHGFGFSFALRQTLQFAGSHLLTSLLSFNIGVELGQLLVLVLLIPGARSAVPLRRGGADGHDHPVGARRAHAWHWMTERFGVLRQFRFEWPVIDAAFWVGAMRLGDAGVVCVAAVLAGLRRARVRERPAHDPASSRTSSIWRAWCFGSSFRLWTS